MARKIFVNLPVRDLDKSMAFFTALGFEFDTNFTNNNAACMIINDMSYVMLLQTDFYKTFTAKKIADSTATNEAIIAVSAASRDEVDDMVNKALAAGAIPSSGFDDQGWMYQGSFQDVDGHLWEISYMEPSDDQ